MKVSIIIEVKVLPASFVDVVTEYYRDRRLVYLGDYGVDAISVPEYVGTIPTRRELTTRDYDDAA